jgi:long-chain acyl-CoA synthetase
VWQIDPTTSSGKPGAGIGQLTALGAEISDTAVRERATTVGAEDMATLIYTSGTTGRPKGCEITHRNLLAVTRSAVSEFTGLMKPENSLLLFLPLAHVFARIIQCCCVYARITLGHTPDAKNVVAELVDFRPTLVLAVPRVFEKVYNSASLARQARRIRPTGLHQASGGARRPVSGSRLRWRTPGRAAGTLLPRGRGAGVRGLRAD